MQTKVTKKEIVKRDKLITLRLTRFEFSELTSIASDSGLSVSDFLRNKIGSSTSGITKNRKNFKFHKADPELVNQIARVGNNLNQIAKKLNQGGNMTMDEKKEFFERLERLEDIINYVSKNIKSWNREM